MVLSQEFRQLNKQESFWRQSERVLLAVSGGVDSMVLLALFEQLPVAERPFFGVVHVNHQLRVASQEEEVFLESYCQQAGIPFYVKRWDDRSEVGNLENQARDSRYDFFLEICDREGYDCVVTAHHADDQAETILMKVTKGTQLQNMVGIRPTSYRNGLVIHRPLLAFSKSQLLAWAEAQQVPYSEDESNQSHDYFRNRMRHLIIPQFKMENANFLKHIHNLVKQITYANDIIEGAVKEIWPRVMTSLDESWRIDLTEFRMLSESQQYMLLVALFQKVLVSDGVAINEAQVTQVLAMLLADEGAQEFHLSKGWRFEKTYTEAYVSKPQERELVRERELPRLLEVGTGMYLSATEWLGFEQSAKPLVLPPESHQWQAFDCPVSADLAGSPLVVRQAKPGDRLMYNQAGNHKKVSRIFIDEKIPANERWQTWLVCEPQGEIIWIVPIKKSYLSIVKETDKIHYRLIYLKLG